MANSTTTFGYTSGAPVVTSNGTDPASAVVWETYSSGSSGSGGMLEAFDAMPQTPCSATISGPCLRMIWSAPIGTASKFAIPATDGGRVYVGTRDGQVIGFGVTATAPLTGAAPVNFGSTAVGGTSPAQLVTETATTTVTVTGVATTATSSANPFTAGPATVTSGGATKPATFPVTLSRGDSLTVPVTFKPTVAGGVSGSLGFATTYPGYPTISVGLTGVGASPGLVASTGRLRYYNVPVGASATKTVVITNDSTTAHTVSRVTGPTAPFTAAGMPAVGQSIAPNQSLTVSVTFTPTQAVTSYTAFTISYPGGHVTVNLAGHAVAAISKLAAASALNFGSAPVGKQMAATVTVTNRGNLPAVLTWAASSPLPFSAQMKVPAGLPVDPRCQVQIPITFTPRHAGAFTGSYQLHWRDSDGAHTLWVRLTGRGVTGRSGRGLPGGRS